jgi:drug/metabolite transporter (DMT)-like permease
LTFTPRWSIWMLLSRASRWRVTLTRLVRVRDRLGLDMNDLGLLGVVVIWGLNLAIVKVALREMLPLAFNAVRFALATLTLLLLLRRFGETYSTGRRDGLKLVGLGLLGHTAYQVFFIEGLARTTASHTALIFGITPVIVAILSLILGHEHVTAAGWAGATLAFGGEYLIIAGKAPSGGPAPSPFGDLLVLVAAICWCFYTVLARPLLARHSPLKVTALSMTWGFLGMLPFCVPALARQEWKTVTPKVWAATGYSFLFALVISYILWYRSVHKVGNVRTAVYSNLVPVTGTLAGWLFLGERLYPALGLGAAAIFGGIALTRMQRPQTPPPSPQMEG